jgi:hypothetical protein
MRPIVLFLCLGVFGCSSNKNSMQPVPDMAAHATVDMSMPLDMTQKNCGTIITCVITSGATNPTAAAGCFQGASTAGAAQAGALGLCAFQNCLSGDAGASTAGNQTALLQCLTSNCQMQLTACQGLPF